MPRPKKRSSSVLRPEILEDRRLLSGDRPGSLLAGAIPAELNPMAVDDAAGYAPDRIIVRYRDDAFAMGGPHPSGLVPGRLLSEAADLRIVGVGDSGVPAALEAARRDPRVLYAEPDYVIRAETAPNDPRFGELWGLNNVGQGSGTAGADIGATAAWSRSTGSGDVVVAVLDSGVDYTHPDLASNIWANPGEVPGNGIDDDGNGYVDDVRGWDFVNRDNNPMDDNSHGTHVAGTIGARGNNNLGVTGVSWDVSIMPLKVLDHYGNGSISAAIDAIGYAWRNGAVISNSSWGGIFSSQALRDAIQTAGTSADHLFVAAAGNSGTVMDAPNAVKFYPAAYDLPNILSVAASDRNDQLAGFSNSGWLSVDLAAPGVDILSTMPGGGYGSKSGTSMAAPHVAGAAALLRADDPTMGAGRIKATLMGSVDPTAQLQALTASGGRLDLRSAMQPSADAPHLRSGVVELGGPGQWETVTLDRRYASMVVAATPEISPGGPSLVPRIRNVGDDRFEISVVDASSPRGDAVSLPGGGFETPEAGPAGSWGSFIYRPSGTPWAYAGDAGVTANGSGFTNANPPAPEGDQVAFIQRTGRISQVVQAAEPGTYRLSFRAAHRANASLRGHDFALVVGGAEVARYTPSAASYEPFEATFSLPAGSTTVALVGLNSRGGDRTSLVDDLRLERVPGSVSTDSHLPGGGFETPEAGPAGSWGSFIYRPSGTPWAYAGDAGVTANGSGFTNANPPAPEGDQVAFIQRTGRISQVVQAAEPGTYRLSFRAAHRANASLRGHDFALVVGGAEVARYTPSAASYEPFEATFSLPAGSTTVALVGLNSRGGDRTSLVDDLRLERVPGPDSDPSPLRVHYLVAEEGTYTAERSGVTMEARKVTIETADRGGPQASFRGISRDYSQPYTMPIVIGQVMSGNDPRPSMFWASGALRTEAPTASGLTIGRHVGEDPTATRLPETVGYFVFEAGAHRADGVDLVAGRTGNSVRGIDDSSPFISPLSGFSSTSSAVLSTSTMVDPDGAWAAFYGSDPVRPDSLQLAAVEDQWLDDERHHAAESVSYVVFGQASGATAFGGRPAIPGLDAIEPRITITRTSGTEPFVVQVSAAETTAGSADAFTDLEYSWDFGDPGGQELFVHPASGAMVNANTGQKGPEAAYVYREPGSYSITLTVRGKDESGEMITATTSTLMRSAEQEVRVRHASGGTFRLTASVDGGIGRTTAPIPYNAGPDAVVEALAALPNIGEGNIRTGAFLGPEAAGDLLGRRLTLSADASGLIGGSKQPEVLVIERIEGGTDDRVTVSGWSGPVVYFDSNYDGASNGTPDGSIEAPFNTFNQLEATLTSGESQRVLLKRGSRFQRYSKIQISEAGNGPIRIGSYGDPALPKPIVRAWQTPISIWSYRSSRTEDIVIDGLDLRSVEERAFHISQVGGTGDEYSQVNNVHLLDTDLSSENSTKGFTPLVEIFAHTPEPGVDYRGHGFVFWNCTYDWQALSGNASYQSGLDLDVTKWVSVIGGTMAGGGAGPDAAPWYSHHVYANVFDHLLLRWMRFGEAEGRVNFAVKLRQEAGSSGQVHSRTLIDGSDFGGPSNGLSFNQERDGSSFGTVIVQDSSFHVGGEDGFQAMGVYGDHLKRLVIRDSEFFDNGRRGVLILGSVEGLSMGYYRNNVFVPPVVAETNGLTIDARLEEAEFLDNTIVSMGSWLPGYNMAVRLRPSLMGSWTVDRNQYWAPNNNGIFALGESIFFTLPTWQARGWDLNGSYADPGWIDPANGDFRRRR